MSAAEIISIQELRSGTLRANLAWMLAGNVAFAGCQWGLLLVLARLGTPELVGQFALGIAVTAPVISFSQLQLRSIQATDPRGTKFRAGDYLALRLATTALAMLIIVLIATVSDYRRETAWVVSLVGMAKASESITDVYYGFAQQRERLETIAKSLILRGLFALTAFSLVVAATRSAALAAAALFAVWLSILAAYDVPAAKRLVGESLQPLWDPSALKRLVQNCLPLGMVTMLLSLNSNLPRYFLQHYWGEYGVGLFSAVISLQAAGSVFINALGHSATPRLARYYGDHNSAAFFSLLRKLVIGALVPGFIMVLSAALAGERILELLFGVPYQREQVTFVWLSAAGAIWYVTSVLGYAATARGQVRFQPAALIIVTATAVGASWYAVPRYGIQGAAAATVPPAMVACLCYMKALASFTESPPRHD